MTTWWLSFSDPTRPKGFLGVVLVDASSFGRALATVNLKGLNPGGEVRGYPLDPENYAAVLAGLPRLTLIDRITLEHSNLGESTWRKPR